MPHEEAAVVGEKVVASLRSAFQHDGRLKLMAELVCRAALVVVRDIGIEEGLCGIEGDVDAELGGMSNGTGRVVINVCGIIEVARIEGIAASDKVGRTCFLAVGYRLADAEEVLLPDREAVQTFDGFGNSGRIGCLEDGCPDVHHRVPALHDKSGIGCGTKELPIVRIGMAGSVEVAVHLAAFDVYLYLRPFADSLGHGLRICRVEDEVKLVCLTVKEVDTFRQLLSRLGSSEHLIDAAACDVERCVRWNIVIYEDIERFAFTLDIDAGWIAHIGGTACPQLVVPVFGIAVGIVRVDAELLFVGSPARVLHFQRNGCHVVGHTCLGKGSGELFVAHCLVFGLELRTGIVLEEGVAQLVHLVIIIRLHRIIVGQCAVDGAIVFHPTGFLVVGQCLFIDIDRGLRREEIRRDGWRRERLDVGFADAGAIEGAFAELVHLSADDDGRQRIAIGKGIFA